MFESAETETAKGEMNVKFLIDTWDGETIEADMLNCQTQSDDVLYVDGVPCRLSTARSLEAEALKDARELLREYVSLAEQSSMPPTLANLKEWLDKWGKL